MLTFDEYNQILQLFDKTVPSSAKFVVVGGAAVRLLGLGQDKVNDIDFRVYIDDTESNTDKKNVQSEIQEHFLGPLLTLKSEFNLLKDYDSVAAEFPHTDSGILQIYFTSSIKRHPLQIIDIMFYNNKDYPTRDVKQIDGCANIKVLSIKKIFQEKKELLSQIFKKVPDEDNEIYKMWHKLVKWKAQLKNLLDADAEQKAEGGGFLESEDFITGRVLFQELGKFFESPCHQLWIKLKNHDHTTLRRDDRPVNMQMHTFRVNKKIKDDNLVQKQMKKRYDIAYDIVKKEFPSLAVAQAELDTLESIDRTPLSKNRRKTLNKNTRVARDKLGGPTTSQQINMLVATVQVLSTKTSVDEALVLLGGLIDERELATDSELAESELATESELAESELAESEAAATLSKKTKKKKKKGKKKKKAPQEKDPDDIYLADMIEKNKKQEGIIFEKKQKEITPELLRELVEDTYLARENKRLYKLIFLKKLIEDTELIPLLEHAKCELADARSQNKNRDSRLIEAEKKNLQESGELEPIDTEILYRIHTDDCSVFVCQTCNLVKKKELATEATLANLQQQGRQAQLLVTLVHLPIEEAAVELGISVEETNNLITQHWPIVITVENTAATANSVTAAALESMLIADRLTNNADVLDRGYSMTEETRIECKLCTEIETEVATYELNYTRPMDMDSMGKEQETTLFKMLCDYLKLYAQVFILDESTVVNFKKTHGIEREEKSVMQFTLSSGSQQEEKDKLVSANLEIQKLLGRQPSNKKLAKKLQENLGRIETLEPDSTITEELTIQSLLSALILFEDISKKEKIFHSLLKGIQDALYQPIFKITRERLFRRLQCIGIKDTDPLSYDYLERIKERLDMCLDILDKENFDTERADSEWINMKAVSMDPHLNFKLQELQLMYEKDSITASDLGKMSLGLTQAAKGMWHEAAIARSKLPISAANEKEDCNDAFRWMMLKYTKESYVMHFQKDQKAHPQIRMLDTGIQTMLTWASKHVVGAQQLLTITKKEDFEEHINIIQQLQGLTGGTAVIDYSGTPIDMLVEPVTFRNRLEQEQEKKVKNIPAIVRLLDLSYKMRKVDMDILSYAAVHHYNSTWLMYIFIPLMYDYLGGYHEDTWKEKVHIGHLDREVFILMELYEGIFNIFKPTAGGGLNNRKTRFKKKGRKTKNKKKSRKTKRKKRRKSRRKTIIRKNKRRTKKRKTKRTR